MRGEKTLLLALVQSWSVRVALVLLMFVVLRDFLHVPTWPSIALTVFVFLQSIPFRMWGFASGFRRTYLSVGPPTADGLGARHPRPTGKIMLLAGVSLLLLLLVVYADTWGVVEGWWLVLPAISLLLIAVLALLTAYRFPDRSASPTGETEAPRDGQTGPILTTGRVFLILLPAHGAVVTGTVALGAGAYASVALKTPVFGLAGGACFLLFFLLGRLAVRKAIARFNLKDYRSVRS